ncbi:hypothetical protein EGR_00663 [Echinococcus granulosus]|uniref:Uncharacterized protein n=1 Tax=Echinococcus granulosus TaxID=6210 RepID=W6UTU8_ECHGR|nr:hypothetical protein EGR_00663 [Echinococcus granulosus]EUB64713.1 hypothetical protein EGR_00663 [Echinococcus granulosus]
MLVAAKRPPSQSAGDAAQQSVRGYVMGTHPARIPGENPPWESNAIPTSFFPWNDVKRENGAMATS